MSALKGRLFSPCSVAMALLISAAGASSACRPSGRLLSAQKGSGPPASSSAGGVLTAAALPMGYTEDLDPYLDDVIKTVVRKRIERYGTAIEPDELMGELMPRTNRSRFEKRIDKIEAHFNAGEELFETELTAIPGFGDAMGGKAPNMHRVHRGAHGGPDTTSCRSCHHRGGDDGAGEWTENALVAGDGERVDRALERNPPPLHGGGAVQILAAEITAVLRKATRYEKLTEPATVRLQYQGVEFGTVRVMPDGSLDTSKLRTIDPDLVVRPFGWKGTHSTLRRFAEEAFQVHHGMTSDTLRQRRMVLGTAPYGMSPATRALGEALGDGPVDNPDRDQFGMELNDDHLSAIAVYLTLLPLPVIDPPRAPDLMAAWRQGSITFSRIGCADCHKPQWLINKPLWTERPDALSEARPPLELDLRKDIRNGPLLRNNDTTLYAYPIYLFSDLRRHDMGPELSDPIPSDKAAAPHEGDRAPVGPQIPASYFLTRPLWGLSDSGPYLHDGRAVTLHDAITAHGGEAKAARDAYAALPPEQQRALQVFLLSLARQPLPEVTP